MAVTVAEAAAAAERLAGPAADGEREAEDARAVDDVDEVRDVRDGPEARHLPDAPDETPRTTADTAFVPPDPVDPRRPDAPEAWPGAPGAFRTAPAPGEITPAPAGPPDAVPFGASPPLAAPPTGEADPHSGEATPRTAPTAPHARAYAAYADIARHHPGDPGVIAAMLLNHVRLQPGEALYLGAGVPHAYLRGLGVEIMASSDNVLRCGLTPKHVDVAELLRVVRFDPAPPRVRRPEATPDGEERYDTPAEEFRLSRLVLAPGAAPRELRAPTPQILLCTAGSPRVTGADGAELTLGRGQSVYVRPDEPLAVSGGGTLFRATVAV
ncbi:hypothetical protein E0L36_00695 [Streptomyces sp. AJS327]|nr:hypothetical protein [Streptomyces sp. AJS327]